MEHTNGSTVKHGNVDTIPEFTRKLKDLKCCDGDSITLECHVYGEPEPNIEWLKDNEKLSNSTDFSYDFNGEIARLAINRVYPEDEGEYKCIASNCMGKSETSACIVVDVPEEKENLLSRQLTKPSGFYSNNSTPRSTPRSTPIRCFSPLPLSYRNTHIDIDRKHKSVAPKFLSIPHNRVAEEGETVRFQCTVGGHPLPWSSWDKNGTIITPSSRISIKEKDDYRTLEIEEVTQEDAGLYRITIENDYGRIEATARLDIITVRGSTSRAVRLSSGSPRRNNLSYSKRLMGNSTNIGGRLALSCQYRGSSTPATKKFYHNGKEIQENDRIKIITDKQNIITLTIDDAQFSDQGEYTCVCETDYDIITTTANANIYESVEDIPKIAPDFIKDLESHIDAKEGTSLDLLCQVDSCVPYEFLWKRGCEVICDSDDFRYIDHGYGVIALRILDPFIYDSGDYTCTVKSEYGECSTTCDVNIYELNENDMINIPEFVKEPLPLVCLHGSVVSFSCCTEPIDAEVIWTVCGREITDKSRNYSIERQPNGYQILHILGAEYKHSGEIKCITYIDRNTINALISFTKLTVLPIEQSDRILDLDTGTEQPDIPAFITKGPEDCTVLVGGTVSLDVIYGGYPEPEIKWMRAGRLINECDTIVIETTDGHSRLLLTEIIADQSGKYTVEAMNAYGTDMASASVAVEGVPDPPGGKPSVSKGPDRVAIAWCGPPYDGGCMITGFILEMQKNNDEWIEIASVVDSLAYTVKNLSYDTIYRFRVRAENVHGLSEPSESSDEVTLEEPTQNGTSNEINIQPGGEFRSRFDILEELGKGRFGIVHKVIEKNTGQILAGKMIKCIKAKDRVKVQEEIAIMSSLKHPKLLQLAAAFESAREIVMVMEYITGGELFERVVADDFTLTERDCILFVRQLCEGVEYMHQKSVVHLDLKPENIMCNTRTSHQIKIIDFGLAQRLTPNTPVRVLFGTPEFIPPEIISYEPIGFQSDMWSVGVICYVLLSGLSPFMGDTDVDTFSNITRADFDFDDEAFDTVSQEAKDFISNLLIHRKEDRLTATECLESGWLAQENDNMSCVKICTNKLKKFVIRRKWQKTGNAIRALGRMATLSANSRRNSAQTNQNSPRPSISGCVITNLTARMSSLNEEEDDPDNFNGKLKPLELKLKKQNCTERSDSGFSECSNCSAQSTAACNCGNSLMDKSYSILEEKQSEIIETLPPIILSTDLLKTKLEIIAETQNKDISSCSSSKSSEISSDDLPSIQNSNEKWKNDLNLMKTNVLISPQKLNPTNTIQMRKNTLEMKFQKESPERKISIPDKILSSTEKCGKVSQLKEKFSSIPNSKQIKTLSVIESIHNDDGIKIRKAELIKSTIDKAPIKTGLNIITQTQTKLSMSRESFLTNTTTNACKTTTTTTTTNTSATNKFLPIKTSNTVKQIIQNSKFNIVETNNNTTTITTGLTRTPIRLSGRIKEVTERLSLPKQSYTSSTKTTSAATTQNSSITLKKDKTIPINAFTKNGSNQKENFKKISAFWER